MSEYPSAEISIMLVDDHPERAAMVVEQLQRGRLHPLAAGALGRTVEPLDEAM